MSTRFVDMIKKEVEMNEDPELNYLIEELKEDISEIPEVKEVSYTPKMVVVLIAPENETNTDKKYYVDINSLMKYAKSSEQPIDKAYDQVLDAKCIAKEDTALLIRNLDLNEAVEKVKYSPTLGQRQYTISGINNYSVAINTLKKHGIPMVRMN